jgi:hypothetical protein
VLFAVDTRIGIILSLFLFQLISGSLPESEFIAFHPQFVGTGY